VLGLACGTAAPSTPAPPATGDEKPQPGGRLVRWVTADPTGGDPSIQNVSSVSDRWILHSYERLLGFKTDEKLAYADMILQPELAESWTVSPDAKTFTFKLRQGVKWQNLPPVNGREFTSADVKFSYEYVTRSGEFKGKGLKPSAFDWWFEGMESVEAPDKYTAVVKFKDPFIPFITYSAVDKNVIYAREVFDKEGDFMNLDSVIGTGPFIFDAASAQRGTRWSMKKNPAYWQPGKPYLDEVIGIVIPDASTAFAALRTKQLDYLSTSGFTMSINDVQQLKSVAPDVVVTPYQNINTDNIYMFLHGPPFDNANLRKAVAYAIDRDEFIKAFADGKGEWSLAGGLPDTFTEAERKQILKLDPEQSKRLLAQEGYANGLNIEFFGSTAYGQIYKTKAELLQAQLKRVGINMSIQMLDHPDYLRRTRTGGKFDITFRGKALFVDIDSYAYAVFHPKGSTEGGGGPNDPFMTPLLEQQRREADPAKRKEIIRTVVKYANEQAYRLGLYYAPDYDAYSPRVHGIAKHLHANAQEFLNAWLTK
jgi:peptide/nickel transport system substrate-binding protein